MKKHLLQCAIWVALALAPTVGTAQTAQDLGRLLLDPEAVLRDALSDEPGLNDVLTTLDRMDRRLQQIAGGQLTEAEIAGLVARAFEANAVRERLVAVRGAGLRVRGCLGSSAGCGAMLLTVDEQLFVVASELAALPASPDQAAALELARQVHLMALTELPVLRAERALDYVRFFTATEQAFASEIDATRREVAGWLGLPALTRAELRGLSSAALRQEVLRGRGAQLIGVALERAVGPGGLRVHSASLVQSVEVGVWHSCGVERVWAIGQLEIDGLARQEISLSSWIAAPSQFAEDPAGPRAEVRFVWERILMVAGPRLSISVGFDQSPPQQYRADDVEQFMAQTLPQGAVFPASECVYRGRTTVGDRERGMTELELQLQNEVDALDAILERLGSLNGTAAQLAARRN